LLLTSGPAAIANAIKDMGAMTFLNLANNSLGDLVLPGGWTLDNKGYSAPKYWKYKHEDGRVQTGVAPEGSKPEGVVAIANAIPDMGALRSLNLADNNLGQIVEGLLPDGWKSKDDNDAAPWLRIEDGHEQNEHPNAKPDGIIAIANAIPNMRALMNLHVGKNNTQHP
jgi:hypothetical protein